MGGVHATREGSLGGWRLLLHCWSCGVGGHLVHASHSLLHEAVLSHSLLVALVPEFRLDGTAAWHSTLVLRACFSVSVRQEQKPFANDTVTGTSKLAFRHVSYNALHLDAARLLAVGVGTLAGMDHRL